MALRGMAEKGMCSRLFTGFFLTHLGAIEVTLKNEMLDPEDFPPDSPAVRALESK